MVCQHRRSHIEDGPVTVLVEFLLAEPENAASLAATVADGIAESLSWRLGFLASTVMVSADTRRLITVARWAREEAWLAVSRHPDGNVPSDTGERDLHWLHRRDSDESLVGTLAESGATLQRVEVLHEVQTTATLVTPTDPHIGARAHDLTSTTRLHQM
jgi:hypothetical protein